MVHFPPTYTVVVKTLGQVLVNQTYSGLTRDAAEAVVVTLAQNLYNSTGLTVDINETTLA